MVHGAAHARPLGVADGAREAVQTVHDDVAHLHSLNPRFITPRLCEAVAISVSSGCHFAISKGCNDLAAGGPTLHLAKQAPNRHQINLVPTSETATSDEAARLCIDPLLDQLEQASLLGDQLIDSIDPGVEEVSNSHLRLA